MDNAQGASNGPSYIDDYNNELDKLDNLRLIRENTEIEISEKEQLIKELKSQVKLKKDELDAFTRQYTLTKNTLNKIDRDRMSIGNKIGDIVRDLPYP